MFGQGWDFVKSNEPTVRRQELGGALRALRRNACFSLEQASQVINVSQSKLSRVETGRRNASIEEIASLLGLYRADHAKRSRVLALAREVDEVGWLQSHRPEGMPRHQTLLTLASEADRIFQFDPVVVPGLLQTGEYKAAILDGTAAASAKQIDDCAALQLQRQSVLTRKEPPRLLALLDESVLHRPVGGRNVLRRQLEHLQKLSTESNCTIRVVPRGESITCGAFALLRLSDRSPVVLIENLTCSLFLEQPHDVEAYDGVVQSLDEHALDEAASLELISSVA